MDTYAKVDHHLGNRPFRWVFWIVAFCLFAGLILSILSWLEICVEHCSANQAYRLFNMPFALIGILFFTVGLVMHFLSRRYHFLSTLLGWMVAAAIGSEIMFIGVQKYDIGHWCPVCLSIAVSVGIAGLVMPANYYKTLFLTLQSNHRGQIMGTIKKGLASLSFVLVGFLMAFMGVSKPDLAQAAMNDIKDRIAFGSKESHVEVYFVSDWFCPSCKKIEPLIEQLFPKIQSQVAFYFIDYPIHKKSFNFVPYNLSFLMYDKHQYFKARQALMRLAEENDSPTDEDIIKLAQANQIPFKELSFVDVKSGMEWFDQIVDKYHLNATPVMIITYPGHNKMIKLEGRDEITEEAVLKAIDTVKK
ncbi:MAG: thioredoxin domain-containing protein [Chlamydiales bacterium]